MNTYFLSHAGGEHDALPPILIMVKNESIDYLSPLNLQNTEDEEVSSFSILLNTEGCYGDVDGSSMLNTNGFELDITLSSLSSSASFAVMYYASDCLSFYHPKIFNGRDGIKPRPILGVMTLPPYLCIISCLSLSP